MKPRASLQPLAPNRLKNDDEDGSHDDAKPTPGWKALRPGGQWANPRSPSVPATLNLTLSEYFAAGALMGILASQGDEPDQEFCRDWAFEMGEKMAREARKRRSRHGR